MDRYTAALLGLFIAFQSVAITGTYRYINNTGTTATQPTQSVEPSLLAYLVGLAAVEITILLVLWRLYKRLPDRWQRIVRTAFKAVVLGTLLAIGYLLMGWVFFPLAAIASGLVKLAQNTGLKYIAFNIVGLLLGLNIAVFVGVTVSPLLILGLFPIALLYDHIAVRMSSIMDSLIDLSAGASLPNYIIIPSALRVDLSEVRSYLQNREEEKPAGLGMIIGVGDLLIPTMLLTSAVVATETIHVAVIMGAIGTLIGVVFLRHSLVGSDDGLPALVWLNTTTGIGFLSTAVLSGDFWLLMGVQ